MNRSRMIYRVAFVFIALSILILLDVVNAGHFLAMFVIAGQIPGTQYFIPADTMLLLSVGALGLLFGRLTARVLSTATTTLPSSQVA